MRCDTIAKSAWESPRLRSGHAMPNYVRCAIGERYKNRRSPLPDALGSNQQLPHGNLIQKSSWHHDRLYMNTRTTMPLSYVKPPKADVSS